MVQSNPASFPIELLARRAEGPPIVIRFVDEPSDVRPLSILVVQHNRDPYYVPALPTYDIEIEEQAARETDLELPRFELPMDLEPCVLSQGDGARMSEEPILLTTRRGLAAQSAQLAQPALVAARPRTSRVGLWAGALAAAAVMVTLLVFGASQVVSTRGSAIDRVSSTVR